MPVWQNTSGDKLVFSDLRGRFDNFGSSEYNVGLGYRQLVAYDILNQEHWIIGAYGFIDRLDSKFDNTFLQTTLGIEAISNTYQFRTNLYLPQDKEQNIKNSEYMDFEAGEGATNIVFGREKEKAFDGVDFEVGYKFATTKADIIAFAGYYYFDESGLNEEGYENIYGPKLRGEVSVNKDHIDYIPQNTDISLGFEFQNDDVAGEQIFAVAKLTYEFGSDKEPYSRRSSLKSKMTNFPIRDIDVKSNTKAFTEDGFISLNDREFSSFIILSNQDDLKSIIESNDANALIVLDGDFDFDQTLNQTINLNENQHIISDQMVQIASKKNPNSRFDFHFDVAKANINALKNNDTTSLFNLKSGNYLSGFNIKNGTIDAANADGIKINNISMLQNDQFVGNMNVAAMNFSYSDNIDINNVTIDDYSRGLKFDNANNININNASISMNEQSGNDLSAILSLYGGGDFIMKNVDIIGGNTSALGIYNLRTGDVIISDVTMQNNHEIKAEFNGIDNLELNNFTALSKDLKIDIDSVVSATINNGLFTGNIDDMSRLRVSDLIMNDTKFLGENIRLFTYNFTIDNDLSGENNIGTKFCKMLTDRTRGDSSNFECQ